MQCGMSRYERQEGGTGKLMRKYAKANIRQV